MVKLDWIVCYFSVSLQTTYPVLQSLIGTYPLNTESPDFWKDLFDAFLNKVKSTYPWLWCEVRRADGTVDIVRGLSDDEADNDHPVRMSMILVAMRNPENGFLMFYMTLAKYNANLGHNVYQICFRHTWPVSKYIWYEMINSPQLGNPACSAICQTESALRDTLQSLLDNLGAEDRSLPSFAHGK